MAGGSSEDRVPDLELDLLALDVDHPGAELDPDGEVVHWLEPLVGELEEQAGLAHAWEGWLEGYHLCRL